MRITPRALKFGGPALGVVGLIGWYGGVFLGLAGWKLWVFRGSLWLLGSLAIFLIYRLLPKKDKGGGTPADVAEVVGFLSGAVKRLMDAGVAGKDGLRTLPVVLFLGPKGNAKTSVVQRAGMEAEFLAGNGEGGEPPPPTPTLNAWLSRKTVFLEVGEGVLQSPPAWNRTLQALRAKALKVMLKGQPSRIAVVCVGADRIAGQSRESVGALGKELRARLNEAAGILDARLPVYVLFTKADEIRFFTEFVRNLTQSESTEPLGVTLALAEGEDPSLYTQWQSQRLGHAFESVFLGLARRRTDVMARAGDPVEKAAAYEFPREFRKLADNARDFLLELTRPSQLRIGPFLRGFYFTGIRPLPLDARPEPAVAPPIPQVAKGATMVFDPSSFAAPAPPTPRNGGRVAQWTFLERLLPEVLLPDQVAVAASMGGPRAAFRKRALYGAAFATVAALGLFVTVSFFGNRGLQRETMEAVRAVEDVRFGGSGVPSLEDLERLEVLRAQVAKLAVYEREDRPLRLRWGLYAGSAIFPEVHRLYFNRFRSLLFESTRGALLNTLGDVSSETTQEDYEAKYRALKAYLITTSFPDSASGSFLTPVLMDEWRGERELDEERQELLRRQFDLYASELPFGNPYDDAADNLTVERARAFLRENANEQSFYAAMLSQANSQFAPVRFNQDFPGSARFVVNPVEVPGAFTAGGWAFVLQGLESATDFFQRESYVVGADYFSGIDPTQMATSLRARYQEEYIRAWINFLSGASVANPGLARAEGTFSELAGPRSPLFQMFDVASANTMVDSVVVGPSFQPLHLVSPPEVTDRLFGDISQPFLAELGSLAGAMGQLADNPGSSSAQDGASAAAQSASGEIDAIRLGFNTSPETALEVGSSVESLLRAPVQYARSAIGRSDVAAMDERGQQFCRSVGSVLQQYPFQIQGRDAALADVNDLLQPDGGALWEFLDEVRAAGLTPSSAFETLLARGRALSDALYGHGGPDPRLRFRLRGQPTDQVPAIALNIDGDEEAFGRNDTRWGNFTWESSTAGEVVLRAEVGGQSETLVYRGTWALFKFFQQASWQPSGSTWRLSWTLDDSGATVQADLDLAGGEPILRRDFFNGFSCPRSFVR